MHMVSFFIIIIILFVQIIFILQIWIVLLGFKQDSIIFSYGNMF